MNSVASGAVSVSHSPALIRQLTLPAMLCLIWVFFALAAPGFVFLSAINLSNLLIEVSITATLAVGMLLVLLPGHTDLSVGSGAGLLGGMAAVMVNQQGVPAPLAMFIALAAGIAIYHVSGRFIVRNRIQSFIATLAGMLLLKGIFLYIISSRTIPVTLRGQDNLLSLLTTWCLPPVWGYVLAGALALVVAVRSISSRRRLQEMKLPVESAESSFLKLFVAGQAMFLLVLVCNQSRGVPLCFLILCVVSISLHMLTSHTPWGRWLYAIGGNEEAAAMSGVPVSRVVITAFTILGGITAVTGFMATAYTGASTTTVGDLMELDAIAACVIGGTSLKGGRGTVLGALTGALIMASLLNGMSLLAVGPELKFMVRGLVLVFAVWLDTRLNR